MRGDGVGVGLVVEGAAVVGIGIVVLLGEELAVGGALQERTKRTMSIAARRRVAGRSVLLTSRGCLGPLPH